ncbi:MAG: hypothetical protein ACOYLH_11750 [Flavobacteriales bacterium]
MSEEMFFQQVKGQLENYSPEVPEALYAGVRRKYARSRFFAWNASRLNIWYVALLLTGAASIFCMTNTKSEVAVQKAVETIETIMKAPVAASCAGTNSCTAMHSNAADATNKNNGTTQRTKEVLTASQVASPNVEAIMPNEPQEILGTVSSEQNVTPDQEVITKEIVKEQEKKEHKKLEVPVLKSKDK